MSHPKPHLAPFVSMTLELASHSVNKMRLKSLLPENVEPSFIDMLIRQNPLITVGDCCAAILRESRQREQAASIATLVNKERERLWKR